MTDLKDLEEKVKNLEKLTAEEQPQQIKLLQELGSLILKEYVIMIPALNVTIEPLLVEAYYYDNEKFPDKSVHSSKESNCMTVKQAKLRQQKNFAKLYIHYAKKKNDGLDICLTDSDSYYLSFLIKNALVNGEWKTQSYISEELCKKCNQCNNVTDCVFNSDVVLYPRTVPLKGIILHVPRKGVSGMYEEVPIASLPLEKILDYDFTLPNGYRKQWRRAVYALCTCPDNEKEAKLLAKEYNNNSSIEEQYWEKAKKCEKTIDEK